MGIGVMLSSEVGGVRYYYHQPKLSWWRRLIGQQYGPGWRLAIEKPSWGKRYSVVINAPPNPALVIKILKQLEAEHA